MIRTLALGILAGLAWSCGSKSLDIGGPPGGDDGGGPSDSGPAATNSTPIITHQRNAASLFSEGSYLYWTTYDETVGDSAYEIWRCDKHDCAGTRQSLFHTSAPGNLVIRGGRAYFRLDGGIVSCPVDDCSTPTVVIRQASGSPGLVDDTNVYWGSLTDNAILACPITGCNKATALVTGVGTVIGMAVDETQLYWTVWATTRTYDILTAPKDGSGVATTLVGGLTKPTSLIADGGFVYWTEMLSSGNLARCATTGGSGGAEILAAEQYYPHYPALDHGALFWLNESAPANQLKSVSRPAKILSCVLPNCVNSIEVLDEANGGSRWDPVNVFLSGLTMVADAEAIYYLGDVATIGQSDAQGVVVDASIRRLMRKPGR